MVWWLNKLGWGNSKGRPTEEDNREGAQTDAALTSDETSVPQDSKGGPTEEDNREGEIICREGAQTDAALTSDETSVPQNTPPQNTPVSRATKIQKISAAARSITAAHFSPIRSPKRPQHSTLKSDTSQIPCTGTPHDAEVAIALPPSINREELNLPPPSRNEDTSRDNDEALLLLNFLASSSDAVDIPVPTENVHCPSVGFVKLLKTFGDITYQPHTTKDKTQTVDGVIKFDLVRYNKFCSPNSPDYDNSLNLDLIAGEVFKPGEVWINRDEPYAALEAQAGMFNDID